MRQAPNNTNEVPPSNNNYMSTVKTYIDNSSINIEKTKNLYNKNVSQVSKLEIINFKGKTISLKKIHDIFFNKTILSLLNEQKFSIEEYRFLFYYFFKNKYYYDYHVRLQHKNSEKFFKKFFNACVSSKNKREKIFFNRDITELINFYVKELFGTIQNEENKFEINELKDIEDFPIDKLTIILEKLPKAGVKYVKNLAKYILAFCNILEYTENNCKYHIVIFETFMKIKNEIFNQYFMKQLYKIFINKGVYKHGKAFVTNLFYPIIYENNKISQHQFSIQTFSLINSILSFVPKNFAKENNKKYSPHYFLNIIVLNKIMDDLCVDEKLKQIMLFKFTDMFNSYINLFIDDGTQLKVAELILTDSANNKIIMNHLDKKELIKRFIKDMDNIYKNQNYWQYFEYLFFDLSIDIFLEHYINDKNSVKNNNLDKSDYFSEGPSQDLNTSEFFGNINITNDAIKNEIVENSQKIINKFINSNDIFIRKYITGNKDLIEEGDINIVLNNKNLEALFILLDIIYGISKRSKEEKIIDKAIVDIKKIIGQIIIKSFNQKKFNCTIFNFILTIDEKYIPNENEFNIINCNLILHEKNFMDEYFKSYPFYIIFIINYSTKYNYNIKNFLEIINGFMKGSSQYVFNYLDDSVNNYYNYTLEINYLNLIYFILRQILNVYLDRIRENEKDEDIIFNLPYCIYCQKKLGKGNYLIYSKYLSQCANCGEKYLYINTNNLYQYLSKNKQAIADFAKENLFKIITDITCHIIIKFEEKYNKKTDELYLLNFNLYYKIMKEHFEFLNLVQYIIGQNIPFVVDKNNIINYKEGALESKIENLFKEFENKNKYPLKIIYQCIDNNNYKSFNSCRKAIKHERALAKNKYERK